MKLARPGGTRLSRLFGAAIGLLLFVSTSPALAQLEGVGYRLAPGASYISFDGNAGLRDGFLFGGGLGLSFGEFLELGGNYFFGPDFRTDFSRFSGLEDAPELEERLHRLEERSVRLERFSGDLQLQLARAGLAPFLVGSFGVLRFSPEGKQSSENIFLSGGGGIQLTGGDRYALAVQVCALTYRYNPGTTFFEAADLAEVDLRYENFNDVQVTNLSAMASLRVYLGGRRPGELTDVDRAYLGHTRGGLRGLALQIEPFAARFSFDERLPYRSQSFVGVETGVDFGPLVGIRGYFARGVEEDDPFSFAPIQLYGGHLRLRLSDSRGPAPFLLLGAGYLDVLDGYESAVIVTPPGVPAREAGDRPFVMGGAGIDLPLSRRVHLNADARAVLISEHDARELGQPEQLHVNPMLRVGASFGLGGRTPPLPDLVTGAELERQLAAEREAATRRIAELDAAIVRARQQGDTDAVARLQAERAAAARRALSPGAETIVLPDGRIAVVQDPAAPAAARDDRVATFPVPERGEIYIRYGDPVMAPPAPGALSEAAVTPTEDELRALVQEAIRGAVAETETPAAEEDARVQQALEELLRRELAREQADLTAAEIQLLERRLMDRLYDELRDLRAQVRAERDGQPIIIHTPGAVAAPVADPTVAAPPYSGIVAALPITGFGAGRGANPINMGLRLDYRTAGGLGGVRYYPELLFGFGGRTSVTVNLNAVHSLPQIGHDVFPYGGMGFGVISQAGRDRVERDPFFGDIVTEEARRAYLLGFNLLLGSEFDFGPHRLFGEVNSVNLTRMFRLMGGYRFIF